MTNEAFLTPVLALIVWTLLIWILLYLRRIPAMTKAKIKPDDAKSPNGDWKSKLPLKVEAPAHNYNHLLEQPTIFYALMFYIVLTAQISPLFYYLAWGYVGTRVLHSFIQSNAGPVILRFGVFTISTLILMGMVVLAIL